MLFFLAIIDASVPTSSDNNITLERSFTFNDLIFFFNKIIIKFFWKI